MIKVYLKIKNLSALFFILAIVSSCTPMASRVVHLSFNDQLNNGSTTKISTEKALYVADKLFSEYGFQVQQNYTEFVNDGGIKWYRNESLDTGDDRPNIFIYSVHETGELIFEFIDSLRAKPSKLSVEMSDKLDKLLADLAGRDKVKLTIK